MNEMNIEEFINQKMNEINLKVLDILRQNLLLILKFEQISSTIGKCLQSISADSADPDQTAVLSGLEVIKLH